MEGEKISLLKFLDFSPLAFIKIGGLALKIAIIVFIFFGGKAIYDKICPAPPQSVHKPEITVQSGGTANYTVVHEGPEKRKWFIPTPYVEVFGEIKTEHKRPEVGSRFGCRWEF